MLDMQIIMNIFKYKKKMSRMIYALGHIMFVEVKVTLCLLLINKLNYALTFVKKKIQLFYFYFLLKFTIEHQ